MGAIGFSSIDFNRRSLILQFWQDFRIPLKNFATTKILLNYQDSLLYAFITCFQELEIKIEGTWCLAGNNCKNSTIRLYFITLSRQRICIKLWTFRGKGLLKILIVIFKWWKWPRCQILVSINNCTRKSSSNYAILRKLIRDYKRLN